MHKLRVRDETLSTFKTRKLFCKNNNLITELRVLKSENPLLLKHLRCRFRWNSPKEQRTKPLHQVLSNYFMSNRLVIETATKLNISQQLLTNIGSKYSHIHRPSRASVVASSETSTVLLVNVNARTVWRRPAITRRHWHVPGYFQTTFFFLSFSPSAPPLSRLLRPNDGNNSLRPQVLLFVRLRAKRRCLPDSNRLPVPVRVQPRLCEGARPVRLSGHLASVYVWGDHRRIRRYTNTRGLVALLARAFSRPALQLVDCFCCCDAGLWAAPKLSFTLLFVQKSRRVAAEGLSQIN